MDGLKAIHRDKIFHSKLDAEAEASAYLRG
jgi:hypothetical protein